MNVDLRLGDCLEVLKTIPDNSIDSIITDPPYHLTSIVKRFGKKGSAEQQYGTDGTFSRASKGFMGKEWDGGDIAFRTDVWLECFRVLKPGAHLLSFSHSRTYHRTAVAIEDAGFEIRDQIMWIYGNGFPKSHNIGKSIDKIQGNQRDVVGLNPNHRNTESDVIPFGFQGGRSDGIITKGNSEWEGWGTALKPAHEPIVMARKPLSEKSIAQNVLKHGTGGINIEASRIPFFDDIDLEQTIHHKTNGDKYGGGKGFHKEPFVMKTYKPQGRFPSNIILDEEAGQLLDEQSGISKSGKNKLEKGTGGIWNKGTNLPIGPEYGDTGGASRFFYSAKASKKEKNEGVINSHPTVKPTSLMEYLINLITPKNGTILDPFMGSGSTGKAAIKCEVKQFIGIEKEEEYMEIAKQRINYELNKSKLSKDR